MKKCHKADHRELVDLRDAYRDVVLEREQLHVRVEALTASLRGIRESGTLAPTESLDHWVVERRECGTCHAKDLS